jgi:hypothetical protein
MIFSAYHGRVCPSRDGGRARFGIDTRQNARHYGRGLAGLRDVGVVTHRQDSRLCFRNRRTSAIGAAARAASLAPYRVRDSAADLRGEMRFTRTFRRQDRANDLFASSGFLQFECARANCHK